MRSLIDRAASNGEEFRRLIESPLAVASEEGYKASPEQILEFLGRPDAGDLQRLLRVRLSQVGGGKWM
jgi:hypothetical protein